MPHDTLQKKDILRDLGDGIIMRRATVEDAEALSTFNSLIHRDEGVTEPDEGVRAWTLDLMRADHPTFKVGDFIIVEDTNTGAIVSTTNHISQTWRYDGVEFKVGRPELVATAAEYRKRGLVRAQFEVLHEWSRERGELVQGITGIPYYYRQFGYAMAMELGGGRAGFAPQLPVLKEGQTEPYVVRPATIDDLPFVAELHDIGNRRYLVSAVRDIEMWRYEFSVPQPRSVNCFRLAIVETLEGEAVGYVRHPNQLWGNNQFMAVNSYEIKPGQSWFAITPSVVRYVWATGRQYAERDGKPAPSAFGFYMGTTHPVYEVIESRLPRLAPPYAWYLRVPDPAAFVTHIAPALNAKMESSIVAGYTGELKLNFYRSGLKIAFEKGKITGAENFKPGQDEGGAGFPDLTFIEVLFGYRTVDELKAIFPDFWCNDEARVLLNTLFPKQPSKVLPIQ